MASLQTTQKLNVLSGFDTRASTYIKVSIAQLLQEISGDFKGQILTPMIITIKIFK